MHIITKSKVIERELLLKRDDTLDMELIKETERKIRQLYFIQRSDIKIDTLSDHTADIYVKTQDYWSLIPGYIIESGGGLIGIGASIEESNLFGLGKIVYAELFNESDIGNTWTFSYYDPQLFGSKLTAFIEFNSGTLVESFYGKAEKPFLSSDDRFLYSLSYEKLDEKVRLFYGGEEISRLRYEKFGVIAKAGYSFGERYKKRKIYLSYKYKDKTYSKLEELTTTPLPENELVSAIIVGFEVENKTFSTNNHIDNFTVTEDFTLGYSTFFSIGRAGFPMSIGVERFEIEIDHNHGFEFKNDQYLFVGFGYQNYINSTHIISSDIQYYNRLSSWNTLAVNLEFEYAFYLEESEQFILGGASGLRGYKAREFTGDKLLLLNLEDRIFTNLELLTVRLGMVGFCDVGHVWNRGVEINLQDLNYSIGIGLRLGFTKITNGPVMRIDLGWALNRRSDIGMSFGLYQQF